MLFKKINLSEAIEKKKSLRQFQLCKSLGQQQIASLLKAPTFYCMVNAKECNQAFGVIKFVKKMHSNLESRDLLATVLFIFLYTPVKSYVVKWPQEK